MAIGINGDFTIAQPSGLKEGLIQKQRDKISAKGVVRRIWLAQKRRADIHFSALTIAQYNQIVNNFYGSGVSVTYTNNLSGFSFVGFAEASEAEYLRGATMLRDLDVTIIEK